MNQTVGLRQEEIQVLQMESEKKWDIILGVEKSVYIWNSMFSCFQMGCVFWPRHPPPRGPLGSCSGPGAGGSWSTHRWSTEPERETLLLKEREVGGGGRQTDKRNERERGRGMLYNIKEREHSQNILCPYIIHTHLQQVSVDAVWSSAQYLPGSM